MFVPGFVSLINSLTSRKSTKVREEVCDKITCASYIVARWLKVALAFAFFANRVCVCVCVCVRENCSQLCVSVCVPNSTNKQKA